MNDKVYKIISDQYYYNNTSNIYINKLTSKSCKKKNQNLFDILLKIRDRIIFIDEQILIRKPKISIQN